MAKLTQNLAGKKINSWTVLHKDNNKAIKKAKWICRCQCGTIKSVYACHLISNKTNSCGKCFSVMSKSYEYRVYVAMLDRCYRKSHTHYHRYGGRGIFVCDHWKKSFNNFLSDMRVAPEGCTLDRINNDGNYEPFNCRWATKKEQSNNASFNKIIEFENKKYTLTQLSEKLNINYATLSSRIKSGKNLTDVVLDRYRKKDAKQIQK